MLQLPDFNSLPQRLVSPFLQQLDQQVAHQDTPDVDLVYFSAKLSALRAFRGLCTLTLTASFIRTPAIIAASPFIALVAAPVKILVKADLKGEICRALTKRVQKTILPSTNPGVVSRTQHIISGCNLYDAIVAAGGEDGDIIIYQ